MPAHRSRTDKWRESLHQIYERNGGIEISPTRAPGGGDTGAVDLVWRVRVLGLNDTEIFVEQPSALNERIPIADGSPLTVGITVGQNRWMFSTKVVGQMKVPTRFGPPIAGLVLAMPEHVERCARRNFMRVSTASVNLPEVECHLLLETSTAVRAERENREAIQEAEARMLTAPVGQVSTSGVTARIGPTPLPLVGPMFHTRLLNVGGGGAGLLCPKGEVSSVDSSRTYWLRVNLTPEVPVPLSMCARIVHTHLDSEQNTYCGVAFDFSHAPEHRTFIAQQIAAFTRRVQERAARAA